MSRKETRKSLITTKTRAGIFARSTTRREVFYAHPSELKPELEATLADQARARGISLSEYLQRVVEKPCPPRANAGPSLLGWRRYGRQARRPWFGLAGLRVQR